MAQLLRKVYAKVASQIRRRRIRAPPKPSPAVSGLRKQNRAKEWLQAHDKNKEHQRGSRGFEQMPSVGWVKPNPDLPTIDEWKIRRAADTERADRLRPHLYREAADLYTLILAQPL